MTSGPTSGPKRKLDEEFTANKMPRQWIGTFNNYTRADVDHFKAWCLKNTTYSVCGYEVGESGTPHLQSFHQTKGRPTFAAFKKEFPDKPDIRPVGKDNGCAKYCKKEGNLAFELGEYVEKKPGKRTDLQEIAASAVSGSTMLELAQSNPVAVMQYGAGLQRLISLHERPRDRNIPKTVKVYYGATGTGKTRRAFDELEDPYVWEPSMGTWFDGYSGHKNLIMDEFRGDLPWGFLLRLLDRYPMRVQYKGGSTQFVADTIIITSPKHPKEWYLNIGNDGIDQLLRRICPDCIIEFNNL